MKKLVKRLVPVGLFRRIEPLGHLVEAVIYQTKAGFPARSMKVIGVTGTDGKTSTSTLITQMLRNSGKKVAMMTTISIDFGDGKGPQDNPSRLTTFGAKKLVSSLVRMKNEGVEWLVLEVTSHALAQHRVWGVPFDFVVMTNVGHEHLDYHVTFENYRDAKRLLFKLANKNKRGKRAGIINAEDPSAELFASDIAVPIMYGTKKGDIRATNVKLTAAGSRYTVKIRNPKSEIRKTNEDSEYRIECHLPGSFNVYNSLAAVASGRVAGLSKQQIEQGIASLQEVEGRMTRVDEGQDFAVIVDYAHTPESFEKLFAEVKPLINNPETPNFDARQGDDEEAQQDVHSGTSSEHHSQATQRSAKNTSSATSSASWQDGVVRGSGKLICVFGSAGRRDEAKRAKQGEIAGKWCDIVVVTEEDDRDIDGEVIMRQIVYGAEKSGKILNKDVLMVHKREEAVQMAINVAKTGDLVMLLGKGHEKSILHNGPQAAELRHLPQDDGDERRVLKREYDEVKIARVAIKQRV